MIILLHTSKTMRKVDSNEEAHRPQLLDQASQLVSYLRTVSPEQLTSVMHISNSLASVVAEKYQTWSDDKSEQSLAIDSFVGDIYSGLRASTLSKLEREYANTHLRILSGLYGILRPFDGIMPYRLEMGYRLPHSTYSNLYKFWGDSVANTLPEKETIINLAAVEYSRLVTPYRQESRIITPRFLTRNQDANEPVFVVVHAKIARGAYARWMITSRIDSIERLHEFNDIGYEYDGVLSTPDEPVFVCDEFGGKGLSMRLEGK